MTPATATGTGPRPGSDVWVATVHPGESDSSPLGSGFLVDGHRVLTCAHVVRTAWAKGELWVAFPKAEELMHRRIRVREVVTPDQGDQETQDVAVLVLNEDVPEELAARLRRPAPGTLVGTAWWSFGFPDGVLGNSSDGTVGEALGYGWVRLDTQSRYPVKAGYSGAALWSPAYQAVVGMVGQARDSTGDARALTLREINRLLPEQKLYLLTDWSAEAAGETALAAWGWTLEADPEAGPHWRPRARGVSSDAERGFRFRGRTAALRHIIDWVTNPTVRQEVLVVTGSPGVGKSAVLGRIVTTADPAIAAVLPPEDLAVRACPGSVSCAVHAKGKTALEVAREIARAVSAPLPESVGDLAPAVRLVLTDEPRQTFTVVLDALDEATTAEEARTIVDRIVLPLVETCTQLGVRILVGSRRRDDAGDLLAAFGAAARILDLDTAEYFEPADLAAYALATLQLLGDERPDNPYADETLAVPVSERIAALADGNFLVAGLIARAHGMYDEQPVTPDTISFTPTVEEALRAYLQQLPPVGGVSAMDALTALAYTEAPGLPFTLWHTAVGALCGTTPDDEQLRRFVRSSAANFLVERSTAEDPVGVFRLFHHALDDALLHARVASGTAVRDEEAVAGAFIRYGKRTGWRSAPAYLLRSLPRHAAAGGLIDELLADEKYLLHADLRRLIPVADQAVGQVARDRAHLLRKTPRAIDAGPHERACLFSVIEAQEALGEVYRGRSMGGRYRAVWAAVDPHVEEAVLEGHGGPVGAVCAVEVEGRTLLASAGEDRTIQLSDPATGAPTRTLVGHAGGIRALCAVRAGTRMLLASGADDRTVRLWDPATGKQVHVLSGPWSEVVALCSAGLGDGRSRLASAERAGTVRLWDPVTGKAVRHMPFGGLPDIGARTLCVVDEGTRGGQIAVGSYDGNVTFHEAGSGMGTHAVAAHTAGVLRLCSLSVGGRSLWASAATDGSMRLQGLKDRAPVTFHTGRIRASCLVEVAGRILLATGGDDRIVRLWDPETGRQTRELRGHTAAVRDLCAVMVGGRTLLASASDDHTVRLWDPAGRDQVPADDSRVGETAALCSVGADGLPLLAAAGSDGAVRFWDPASGRVARTFQARGGGFLRGVTRPLLAPSGAEPRRINGLAVTEVGGRTLLVGVGDRSEVHLWDPATGKRVRTLKGHTGGLNAVCSIRERGRVLLVTAGSDYVVQLWDAEGGRRTLTLRGHTGPVRAACAVDVEDRTVLASGGDDRTLRLWDPTTGREAWTLEGHGGPVRALCTLETGGRVLVASGGDDRKVRLWDPVTGRPTRSFEGHADVVRAVHPVEVAGRTLLASGGDDRTVRLWDPETSAAVMEIPVRYPVFAITELAGLLVAGLSDGLLALTLN